MGAGGRDAGASAARGQRVYSRAEVAKHCTEGDCFLVIKGKVYDVSNWSSHPGGRVIYTHAGQDATGAFVGFHSGAAHAELERFCVGACPEMAGAAEGEKAAFEAEVRALMPEIHRRGLFAASLPYYAFKFASTTAIGVAGVAVATAWPTVLGALAGGALLALFWQQCGWLAHDFAHHQVFKDRALNDRVVLVLEAYLGFSLDWWKNKHNTHHAIPNVLESANEAHDGDPDIDTLPFLAWSKGIAAKLLPAPAAAKKQGGGGGAAAPEVDSALARLCVSYQEWLYFPLLLFARSIWCLQSAAFVFRLGGAYWGARSTEEVVAKKAGADAKAGNHVDISRVALRYELLERLALVAHYAWLGATLTYVAVVGSPAAAAVLLATAQMLGGLLLALAFGVGHNGMPVYEPGRKPGFAELAVTTTRNVDDGLLVGWFMGGLHFQIEHHIFPTVPRHNLAAVRGLVEPLCRKHGVPYRSTSLWEGTLEILRHLREVSTELANGPM